MASRTDDALRRLLVLCADEELGEAAAYWGRALGFTVDTSSSGARAARLLRASRYWALLTDRCIPPWPGLGSIPRLKRRHPDIRIVVLLERGPIGVASVLRLVGADVVIEPPLRQTALLAALLPGRNGLPIEERTEE
jgi:DNA-binding response OmpR family regulator